MLNKNKLLLYLPDIGWVVKKISFILLTLFIIRLINWKINYSFFSDISPFVVFKALLYAVRVDLAMLLILNAWLILLISLFPVFAFHKVKWLNLVFLLSNGLLLLLSICDAVFFECTQRRVSPDILMLAPQSFTPSLIWLYLWQHWYWLLLLIAIGFIIRFKKPALSEAPQSRTWQKRLITGVVISMICFIAIRGVQRRPLSPSTALMYFPPKLTALISNTGFNLLYSYYHQQNGLKEKNYFSTKELDERFSIYHEMHAQKDNRKPNIVLFIMESFNRYFLDSTSAFRAQTPFLDSILKQSMVFKNALCNGNESTHGLVSILTSLPPFMETPYYHSIYNNVQMNGLGDMLSGMGYDCSFFLGDVDNSFGFRELTNSIGIKNYYSMKDFGNDKLYNGAWGIHDDYFFAYAADVLLKKLKPFFATIYNVSSHPPFLIPEERKVQFTIQGQNAQRNSVSYVDYAYRRFFDKIKYDSSYLNTIFIFIADHTYTDSKVKVWNTANVNDIPFFIFKPGNSELIGARDYVVQQLDILPTILDLSGYVGKYMSFGKSVFDANKKRYSVQKRAGVLQIMDSSYVLGLSTDTDSMLYLYNYKKDVLLNKNLVADTICQLPKNELSDALKAMIQRYNYSMRNNKLYYE